MKTIAVYLLDIFLLIWYMVGIAIALKIDNFWLRMIPIFIGLTPVNWFLLEALLNKFNIRK